MSLTPNWEIQFFGFLILRNSLASLMFVASDPTVLDSLLCICAAPQNTTAILIIGKQDIGSGIVQLRNQALDCLRDL
ncbi:hypothetical protein DSO57_1012862 [Entomophthora muscae]|uniref:Uncharacterized protein n=1 Tax=Entomophthora muscae TaxID=34485 RepID=A0ACC2RX15_9FUNG|nr:hypothetical protein DSO57_1012862 [Entomophthora muscae]